MDKDVVELIARLFTPKVALVVVIILGVLAALYTVAIKFWFDKKLKGVESRHATALEETKAELARETQAELKDIESKHNVALERLKADLSRKTQDELQRSRSRLDYEYEARKRLYHECEPLVFELLEFSENAADRIRSLARSARREELPDSLVHDEYYIASTMYYLLAPVVVYKLMRRRLTVVDMALDRNTAAHYRLAKQIAWSFTDDFTFAWGLHVFELPYDPKHADWTTRREQSPAEYWRQGLPYGRLDNAAESMIIRDSEPDGYLRIMSFGEFESALHEDGSTVFQTFANVQDILAAFHPNSRPVLWRILVAQAHIYDAIVRFHNQDAADRELMVTPIRAEDRERFYWKKGPDDSERQQMEVPFSVAETYLQKSLPTLFRKPNARLEARAVSVSH